MVTLTRKIEVYWSMTRWVYWLLKSPRATVCNSEWMPFLLVAARTTRCCYFWQDWLNNSIERVTESGYFQFKICILRYSATIVSFSRCPFLGRWCWNPSSNPTKCPTSVNFIFLYNLREIAFFIIKEQNIFCITCIILYHLQIICAVNLKIVENLYFCYVWVQTYCWLSVFKTFKVLHILCPLSYFYRHGSDVCSWIVFTLFSVTVFTV